MTFAFEARWVELFSVSKHQGRIGLTESYTLCLRSSYSGFSRWILSSEWSRRWLRSRGSRCHLFCGK